MLWTARLWLRYWQKMVLYITNCISQEAKLLREPIRMFWGLARVLASDAVWKAKSYLLVWACQSDKVYCCGLLSERIYCQLTGKAMLHWYHFNWQLTVNIDFNVTWLLLVKTVNSDFNATWLLLVKTANSDFNVTWLLPVNEIAIDS